MKAYLLDRYQKNGALRLADVPQPEPGPGDILVQIHAAGLNPLDSKIRDGAFKPILPYRPPLILGHDLAGTVVRVGDKVTHFRPGDEVYARPRDGRIGSFAQFIAVDAADAARKPANLSMAEAAAVPLTALTAWQALVGQAALKPGQKVLIHAGSGGVGTLAIQLARHLGATVASTTGPSNLDLVKRLGADVVINYREQAFEALLSDYDVVLNSPAGDTLVKSLAVLKPGGKLISLSGPPDPAFARRQGLNWMLRQVVGLMSFGIRRKARAAGIDYSFLFMRADGGQLAHITSLIENGVLHPVVDRVVPFEALNEAIAYLDTGRAKGKVVASINSAAS